RLYVPTDRRDGRIGAVAGGGWRPERRADLGNGGQTARSNSIRFATFNWKYSDLGRRTMGPVHSRRRDERFRKDRRGERAERRLHLLPDRGYGGGGTTADRGRRSRRRAAGAHGGANPEPGDIDGIAGNGAGAGMGRHAVDAADGGGWRDHHFRTN